MGRLGLREEASEGVVNGLREDFPGESLMKKISGATGLPVLI